MSIGSFIKLAKEKQEAILNSGTAEFAAKSYNEASTDAITKNSGISKGLLFHYFGSKKDFYLYCLRWAIEKLTAVKPFTDGKKDADFYEVIFSQMDEKMRLAAEYPDEMHFVNMAARETAGDIAETKKQIFAEYMAKTQRQSLQTLQRAINALTLKYSDTKMVTDALLLYIQAVISKYMSLYQLKPDDFFSERKSIQQEIKQYMDLMLYGIVKEENQ